ncbi:hypothetical protein [Maridesulfovibrio ferrireducens]|nr:hypothetical protein [Maridesulfovibrio ferrireducens]
MALKVLLVLISVAKNWLLVIFEKDESEKKKLGLSLFGYIS